MTRKLNEKDIRAVLTGAAFFGAGGGGSLQTALAILSGKAEAGEVSVDLTEPAGIPAGGSAVVMTGLYQPEALAAKDAPFAKEPGLTVTAMKHSAYMAGKRLEAVLPMERGAVSMLVTLLCAMEAGVPVVDADGCGRGVPGIDVTLFEKGNIAFSPAVLCDDRGNTIRVYPYQANSSAAAANMCHYLCGAFNNVSCLGAWIAGPEDIAAKLILGGVTASEKVGKAILTASGKDVCKALEKELPLRVLAAGKVTEKTSAAVTLACEDGKTCTAGLAKVTAWFRAGDETLAVCPDLICAVDLETGLPVSNEEITAGQTLRYYALPAPEQWQKAEALWRPYLA